MSLAGTPGSNLSRHQQRGEDYRKLKNLLDQIIATYTIEKKFKSATHLDWLLTRRDSSKLYCVILGLFNRKCQLSLNLSNFENFLTSITPGDYDEYFAECGYFENPSSNSHFSESVSYYASLYGNDSFLDDESDYESEVEELDSEDDNDVLHDLLDYRSKFMMPENRQFKEEIRSSDALILRTAESVSEENEIEKILPWIENESVEEHTCRVVNLCQPTVVVYAPPQILTDVVELGIHTRLLLSDTKEMYKWKIKPKLIITSYPRALKYAKKRAISFIPSRKHYDDALIAEGRCPNHEKWADMYKMCIKTYHTFINEAPSPKTTYRFHIPHD